MIPSLSGPSVSRSLRLALRGLLVLWAGSWVWLVLAVSYGGGEAPPPAWIPLAWLASLAALVLLTWRWPIAGGIALIAAAVWAASVFPAARVILSLPALVLGLGHVLLGAGRQRAAAVAVVLVLGLCASACLVRQDPADLPFETRTILRHDDGSMRRGFLLEEAEIAGFPARRWVWWYEDGSVESFELAADARVQDHDLPARSRVFLDREGRLAHVWLSQETVIDGLPCRGKMKIDTAFHPNGRVRAFFPPDTIEIDGIACVASVFHPVYLHPDGHLRQCKLARAVTLDGRTYEKGITQELVPPPPPAR